MKRSVRFMLCAILACLFSVCGALSLSAAEPLLEWDENAYAEREMIARTLDLTLGDAPYITRLALAAVIINRKNDPAFPSDIASVIFERGEFECVGYDSFKKHTPSALSLAAARDAMLSFDVTAGALYYKKCAPGDVTSVRVYHGGYAFW